MILKVLEDKVSLARAAADHAATTIRSATAKRGIARVIAATGASQLEFLKALTETQGIDWKRVELFHLDEYIGLSSYHPASFRKYIQARLIDPTGILNYHLLDGTANPGEVIRHINAAIRRAPVDVAFTGIGENGHLAFNDPPADFETEQPYIIVQLDAACRQQQVSEGWFTSLLDVPQQAISMSIRQILKAKEILSIVPDSRKAKAVQACLEGEISPTAPASILRAHSNATIYLDRQSSVLLRPSTLSAFAAPQ
ncbi:MAG TPA: glucosamine-6-phosphate deaminase [Verrucomicrobiae bacterium]|nr:glucosamine-6-phosphate deaminase [Verrucomicrobiae bacterium]